MSTRGPTFYHFRLGRPVGDFVPDAEVRGPSVDDCDVPADAEDVEAIPARTDEERREIAGEVLAETEGDGHEALMKELGLDKIRLDALRTTGHKAVTRRLVQLLAERKITVRQVGRFQRRILGPLFKVSSR